MRTAPTSPRQHDWLLATAVLTLLLSSSPSSASECDAADPDWLLCEDFEDGALGFADWYAASSFTECLGCSGDDANPDRIRLTDEPARVFDGDWALFMPAEAAAGYQGADLIFRTCDGEQRAGCDLVGYEQLYFRAWVRLDPDHAYVHHFLNVSGTQADDYWGADGNAGCRPNGEVYAGTTLDFDEDHELFFYTYTPDMTCDSGGYCSGSYAEGICSGCAAKGMPCEGELECCWGNTYSAEPRPTLERGRWVCLELGMTLNTPGVADGEMEFFVDGALGHRQTGMYWRDTAAVQLNKVRLQHYIDEGDADQPNRVAFDNVVVSTAPIGCGSSPGGDAGVVDPGDPPTGDAGVGPSPDDGGAAGADPDGGVVEEQGEDEGFPTGCGCRAASAGDVAGLSLLLLTVGLLGRRRRREA